MLRFTFLFTLAALMAAGQEFRATLIGRVTDPQAKAVAGAKVRVENSATGVLTAVETNGAGDYLAPFLVPGDYTLSVAVAGFKSFTRKGLEIRMQDRTQVDVVLEVGAVAESVDVVETAPLIDLARGARGDVVSQKLLAELPVNGRAALMLTRLMPGVSGGTRTFGRVFDNGTVSDFNISGGPRRQNEILIDGITNTSPSYQVVTIASAEAVQEVRVQTNAYDAEYGRTTGGIVNTTTKSGTNSLHGSLYDYFRNDALDANSFFSNRAGIERARVRYHQFGFAAGGPAYVPKLYNGRNRSFFFFNYEGVRQNDGRSQNFTVPTALERTGDFTRTLAASGAAINLYDPATTRANPAVAGQFTRDLFPGNRIPAARLSRPGQRLASFYPEPNQPGRGPANLDNYFYTGGSPETFNSIMGRIDQVISARQRMFLRGQWGRRFELNNELFGPGNPANSSGDKRDRANLGAALDYTNTLTPSLLLNLRYGFIRFEDFITNISEGFDLVEAGFPAAYVGALQRRYFPQVSVPGMATLGRGGSTLPADDSHTVQAVATWIRGKHAVRFGTDARLYQQNSWDVGNASYSFSAGFTQGPDPLRSSATAGFPLAGLLLGTPSAGSVAHTAALSYRSKYAAFYAQDDVRVSRKLTLNLGLRFDHNGPWTERFNRLTRGFAFGTASPLRVAGLNLDGGLLYAGVGGQPAEQAKAGQGIAPRFGFAYGLNSRTVFRGGFGLFWAGVTHIGTGNDVATGFSVTSAYAASIDGGLTPATTLANPFPAGFQTVTGAADGLRTQIGQQVRFFDPSRKVPYAQQFSLSLGRQLNGSDMVEVSYSGTQGRHFPTAAREWNALPPQLLSRGAALVQSVPNPFRGLISAGALAGATVPAGQLLRPYPQFTSVLEVSPTQGSSAYHSLQAKFERRFAQGVSGLVSYTWAKLMDNFASPQNHYDLRAERSVSSIDRTHRLTAAGTFELPFGRGRKWAGPENALVSRVISGWQLNTLLTVETGPPLGISVTPNTSGALGGGLRPNSTGRGAQLSHANSGEAVTRFFDTAQFTRPEPYTFGNVGPAISSLRGPGTQVVDLSLFWKTPIREGIQLQLRLEAFNAFNRTHFANPGTTLGTAQFGQISNVTQTANPGRQIQISARVQF